MDGAGLFEDLAEFAVEAKAGGAARLREPVRDQIELRAVDLEALIGADHAARTIWAYVEALDLGALEATVRARTHTPGQAPVSPRLLLALWLYATSQGVGSARALAKLCTSHDAYRWLCGGVGVNYHGLSDFRTAHPALLDRLLSEHLASLSRAGVVDLDEVVQDGVRVRAAAGSASYRRRRTLRKELNKARRLVARLKQETHDDAAASNRRIAVARRAKTNKKQMSKQKEPRASTTDPQARVMKMADGGFRPAYNCQLATVAAGQIVVAATVVAVGSDRGLIRPMIERIAQRHGRRPKRYLVDGGFTKNADTEWAWQRGVKVYGPAVNNKHDTDPYAPRRDDGPGVAAWRRRMKSPHGKGVYKRRAPGECINARFRQWRLHQFTVRGVDKVGTVLRMFALANNILAGHRLLAAVG